MSIKNLFASVSALVAGLVVGVQGVAMAAYDNASTTSAISANTDTWGGYLQTNLIAILTAVAPYAIGIMCVFIGWHFLMRTLRGSAR